MSLQELAAGWLKAVKEPDEERPQKQWFKKSDHKFDYWFFEGCPENTFFMKRGMFATFERYDGEWIEINILDHLEDIEKTSFNSLKIKYEKLFDSGSLDLSKYHYDFYKDHEPKTRSYELANSPKFGSDKDK